MSNTDKVLNIARRELGVKEDPPESNRVKYNTWFYGREVRDTAKTKYPWCMAFVQWVFAQAGQPLPFVTASCSGLLGWYRQNRPECIVKDPEPGDIIIYTFSHTGILESAQGGIVTAIEGNTSAGDDANGGQVQRRQRGRSLVKAYIRPHAGQKKEEDEDMDQEKFNKMFEAAMTAHRKKFQDNDASSYSEEARAWAVARGIVRGGGKLPDGTDNYMWEDLLTREQMAALLYRFALITGQA